MDKETLSNYGWIVICVLVLAVMIALAGPFGTFVAGAIKSTTAGLFDVNQAALGSAGINVDDLVFENCDHLETEIRNVTDTYTGDTCCKACGAVLQTGQTVRAKVPEGGKYTAADGTVYNPGDEMPETPKTGDKYEYQKYVYKYNQERSLSGTDNNNWKSNETMNGWGVGRKSIGGVTDWGELLSSINGAPIVSLSYTYANDISMTVTPVIPESVTNLAHAFDGCYRITTAPNIPNGVIDMTRTFQSCTALTDFSDMKIPNTLTIMEGTFYNCTSLTSNGLPVLPTSVENLTFTFGNCTSITDLSKLVIPNSVTIMKETFYNCTNLTVAPNIPNSVVNMYGTFRKCTNLIESPVLQHCTNLQDIMFVFTDCKSLNVAPVLPNSVTSMYQVFAGCESLTLPDDFVIPNSVTNLSNAFSGCTSISDITGFVIPKNVTEMGNAFYNCTSLTGTLTINADVPGGYSTVFKGIDFEAQNLTLAGPCRILDYMGASGTNYCAECNGKCQSNH